jgi:hypothetical protein
VKRVKTIGAQASQFRGTVGTPLLYAGGAVALGMALPRFEAAFLPGLTAPNRRRAGDDAAREAAARQGLGLSRERREG